MVSSGVTRGALGLLVGSVKEESHPVSDNISSILKKNTPRAHRSDMANIPTRRVGLARLE